MPTPSPTAVPLDRATFVRAIAHRGLHDAKAGIIENTAPAFAAALGLGHGVECDLQPAADGTPMVFHDVTLDRLTDASGRIDQHTPMQLHAARFRGTDARMLSFAELLELTTGRGPLLVEVKSEWTAPRRDFLGNVARIAASYSGALALMSFNPDVMAALAALAPKVPRGIVAGRYQGPEWVPPALGAERAERLTHLLDSRAASPSFYAYDVEALPTPVTRYVRDVQGLPLFAWTVRSVNDRKVAATHADAPIFEGPVPGRNRETDVTANYAE